MLCQEEDHLSPTVYIISYEQQAEMEKLLLTVEEFATRAKCCCFAGDEDELVVASAANGLNVWSVADGEDSTMDRKPIYSLRPSNQDSIASVRYSKNTAALASGDEEAVIKLWTSNSKY